MKAPHKISATRILLIGFIAILVLFYADGARRVYQFFNEKESKQSESPSDNRAIDRAGVEVASGIPASAFNTKPTHEFGNGPDVRCVTLNEKYVFVDESGNQVIPESFRRVRPFSEGLAAVSNVSHTGTPEDDRTHLSFGSEPWHYIDRTGKRAFNREFARVSEFHCGRAVVTTLDRPWNPICIDTEGKTILDNWRFYEIRPFSKDGYAIVSTGWPHPKPSGLVNTDGKLVLNNIRLANFSEGLGAFLDRATGRYGYVDATGKVVIQPQFFEAGPFSEGIAVVAVKDLADTVYEYSTCAKLVYGFVDRSGKVLDVKLKAPHEHIIHASDFKNGKSIVTLGQPRPPWSNY